MTAATPTTDGPDTVQVTVRADIYASVQECIAERDEGIARAESGDLTGWNKALIDQAIDVFARTGEPFSANDLRAVLPPDVTAGGLMGNRFTHALKDRGVIRWSGDERSLKPNTHMKPIGKWVGIPEAYGDTP